MKRTLLLVLLLAAPLLWPLRAAYTTASISAIYTSETDATIRIAVTCAGTGGDPNATTTFSPVGLTALEMRTRVWEFCDAAARSRNLLGAITVGQNVVRPPAPPVPTAEQLWRLDFARWLRVKTAIDAGILTGAEAEVVALKNTVTSGYQAGFLANF